VRKIFGLVFVLAFGLVLFSGNVGAQYFYSNWGVEGFIQSAVDILEPILRALFGGQSWDDYLLFEKLLLFVLIGVIAYLALDRIPIFNDQSKSLKHLKRLIAVIVALLGIRNLDYVWLNTIFIQYQVLFIAIAGIFPFVIYWFFVYSFCGCEPFEGALRKIMWIFFAIIYFGLWLTTDLEAHTSVYLWTALVALAYAFFLDAAVNRWLRLQKVRRDHGNATWDRIDTIDRHIETLQDRINRHPGLSPSVRRWEGLIRELEKQRDRLSKDASY